MMMDKENVIPHPHPHPHSSTALHSHSHTHSHSHSHNLPPKQKTKQRYQLEQQQQAMNKSNASAQVSKLVAIEERLAQLHSFNDEAFAEVISLLTEVITASTSSTTSTTAAATSETENGLARCLSRLSALQREYSTRRAAAEHRLRLRQASLEASLRASLQQIRDEGDADAAETTVAILHRQRTKQCSSSIAAATFTSKAPVSAPSGRAAMSNSPHLHRKRSLPAVLGSSNNHLLSASFSSSSSSHQPQHLPFKLARRPSVPCTGSSIVCAPGSSSRVGGHAASLDASASVLSAADRDLLTIKTRLGSGSG